MSPSIAPISQELLDRAFANEPEAWRQLLALLLPKVMQGVKERLGYQRNGVPDRVLEADLLSAWQSFQRHFLQEEFQDAEDLETLATHFVRIAFNRWQRQRRHQKKMAQAIRKGHTREEEGLKAREFEDPLPTPGDVVEENDFFAYLWRTIDQILEEFSEEKRIIVRLHLDPLRRGEERRTQKEIARDLGMNQSTVSRSLEQFFDRVRQCLAEKEAR